MAFHLGGGDVIAALTRFTAFQKVIGEEADMGFNGGSRDDGRGVFLNLGLGLFRRRDSRAGAEHKGARRSGKNGTHESLPLITGGL